SVHRLFCSHFFIFSIYFFAAGICLELVDFRFEMALFISQYYVSKTAESAEKAEEGNKMR
ncbi:MAG: hypothetical protein AAFR37_08390, partial [Cyanobacteria bacterium J06628_3]